MKSIQIPGEIKALVDQLRDVRFRLKADKKFEEDITTQLKAHSEGPAMLRWNKDIVAMIEEKIGNRLDADKVRALYPQVATECTVESKYLTVKVC